jgi:hypothetical protein
MNNEFDLIRAIAGEPIETVAGTPVEFVAYRPTAEAGKQLIIQVGTDILMYPANGRYPSRATNCYFDLHMKSVVKQVDWSKMPVDTILDTKYSGKFAFSSINVNVPEILINVFMDGGTSYTCCDTVSIPIADVTISTEQPWTVWLGGECPIPDGLEFEYIANNEIGRKITCKENARGLLWTHHIIYAYRLTGKLLEGYKL